MTKIIQMTIEIDTTLSDGDGMHEKQEPLTDLDICNDIQGCLAFSSLAITEVTEIKTIQPHHHAH